MSGPRRVVAIDSHTGGEPTRIVIDGGPDLGGGSLADRCRRFREQHDDFRSAVVNEPRGSDVLVGALLVPPRRSDCAAGVIFFNNVGYLGMCGHGTIGLRGHAGPSGPHRPRRAPHRHARSARSPRRCTTTAACSVANVPSYR